MNKEQTIRECDEFVETLPENANERYRLILEKIDSVLDTKTGESYGFLMMSDQLSKNYYNISFLWFLLNLVIDDENYAGNKENLLKYLARYFDIEASIFTELETVATDLSAIAKERVTLEASEKSWKELTPILQTLQDREQKIREYLKNSGINPIDIVWANVSIQKMFDAIQSDLSLIQKSCIDTQRLIDFEIPVLLAKATALQHKEPTFLEKLNAGACRIIEKATGFVERMTDAVEEATNKVNAM